MMREYQHGVNIGVFNNIRVQNVLRVDWALLTAGNFTSPFRKLNKKQRLANDVSLDSV